MTGIQGNSIQVNWGVSLTKAFDQGVTIAAGMQKVINDPVFIFGASGSRAINLLYWKDTALAGSAVTVNMFGVLTDAFGDLISPAFIKALVVYHNGVTAGQPLIVGNAASTPFIAHLGGTTPTFKTGAGGLVLFTSPVDGYAAGTGAGNIKFDPGAFTFGITWAFAGSTA